MRHDGIRPADGKDGKAQRLPVSRRQPSPLSTHYGGAEVERWIAIQRLIGNRATMALIQRSDWPGIERRAAIPVQGVWDRMEQWKAKYDYGESVNPTDLHPEERSDDMSLRLNPMWYPLKKFPRKLLLERLNARWIFTVADNGDIYIGVDRVSGTIEQDEFERLLGGMREKDPTLTAARLRDSLDRQGHPTVAARFESDGKTKIGSARIAGHLEWNEESGRFEVTDASGRYMSPDARPISSATHDDTNPRHLNNVARRMSSQLGVEIHAVRF